MMATDIISPLPSDTVWLHVQLSEMGNVTGKLQYIDCIITEWIFYNLSLLNIETYFKSAISTTK